VFHNLAVPVLHLFIWIVKFFIFVCGRIKWLIDWLSSSMLWSIFVCAEVNPRKQQLLVYLLVHGLLLLVHNCDADCGSFIPMHFIFAKSCDLPTVILGEYMERIWICMCINNYIYRTLYTDNFVKCTGERGPAYLQKVKTVDEIGDVAAEWLARWVRSLSPRRRDLTDQQTVGQCLEVVGHHDQTFDSLEQVLQAAADNARQSATRPLQFSTTVCNSSCIFVFSLWTSSWPLETSLVTWTFGGDATVLADYALTTTTTTIIVTICTYVLLCTYGLCYFAFMDCVIIIVVVALFALHCYSAIRLSS